MVKVRLVFLFIKNQPLRTKLGWDVIVYFQLGLHKKDRVVLDKIKNKSPPRGLGKIYEQDVDVYKVQSVKDLKSIIDHFDNYPLITNKRADYELWKQVVEIVKNKEHLTLEGLQKIVAIKATLNWGLSDTLKAAFPEVVPVNDNFMRSTKNIRSLLIKWFYVSRGVLLNIYF